jgi:DNA-binding CsgD family transcriptional regulator
MAAVESSFEGDQRSVSILADATALPGLREAVAGHAALHEAAAVHRFTELVMAREFPGDVVVLTEPAGAPLLAHARTAVSAGGLVVVHADVDDALREKLDAAGVGVVPANEPASAVADAAASIRRRRTRALAASDPEAERPRLSHSERRALAHYTQGLTTVQVAQAMDVGYETAKTFLRRVRAKYAAVDRPTSKRFELVLRAEEDGII